MTEVGVPGELHEFTRELAFLTHLYPHFANTYDMSVTRLVSHLGMSSHSAAPHRAELGFAQFGSVEQQLAPEVTFPKQFLIAVSSASLSANGAASAPGMRVQPTTHNATSARDREIRIPGLDRLRGARGGAFQRRREDFGTARSRPSRVRNILEKKNMVKVKG